MRRVCVQIDQVENLSCVEVIQNFRDSSKNDGLRKSHFQLA